ncbi:unnamed protein product [Ilex paraguariensis]|uniref:Uncharacterized protein n=1 Tax=Ilex paraguariensis TaxID=185542 RepID=A0ABC8TDZ2_9AQUA
MVLKKRLNYEFNGYHLPVIPRAPRSIRRRASQKKSVEDSQICAFELLAAVAGKLLHESESSASSNAAGGKDLFCIHKHGPKQQLLEEGKAFRSECLDQGSCIENVFIPEATAQGSSLKSSLKEFPHGKSGSALERTSNVTSPNFTKNVACDVKLEIGESKTALENFPTKADGGCSNDGEASDCKMENGMERQVEAVQKQNGDLTAANTCGSKDPTEICVNTRALISSESSVQLPLYSSAVPNASFPKHRIDVKLVTRDDDENSFRCNQPSTTKRAFRPRSCIGYRRLRKMLKSKYWNVAPKLKDYELSNTDQRMKSICRNRKTIYTHERCEYEAPSKRRKLIDHSSTDVHDQEASSESISNIPEKNMKRDKSGSAAFFHRANRVSTSVKGHQASSQSKDCHVKFSIKSFRVPELYIEIPETATVGSLKRTVVETVTAILGGGLRVGVLLQGKKVRDDNRTLLQTGISHCGNLDTLGFTLEPSFSQTTTPLKDTPMLVPCEAHQQSPRSLSSTILELGFPHASGVPPLVTNTGNHVESTHELLPSPANALTDGAVRDSKALVVVPPMSVEALAVVPMNHETKHSILSQRRTRRPFSVIEVEALVEAVEKLGTGRWRDVKIRSFDSANHRTYVDLKDKWKTLVHTASISAQQRRGEPVPQELLDRVLAAHGYWSQNQSKQHGKLQADLLKFSEDQMEQLTPDPPQTS